MATDEEYLDNLLKSMTDQTAAPSKTIDDAFTDLNDFEGTDYMSDLSGTNDLSEGDALFGDNAPADDGFLSKDASSLNDDDWMNELSELLGQENQSDIPQSMEEIDKMNFENLIDKLGDGDDELNEINGLLMNAGQDETDDDMLALLEGMDNSEEQEESQDVFHALDELAAEDDSEAVAEQAEESADEEVEEIPPEKEKKKRTRKEKPEKKKPEKKKTEKKKRLFGKKKRDEQTEEEAVVQTEMVVPIEVAESVIEREKKAAEGAQTIEDVAEGKLEEESGGSPETEEKEEKAVQEPETEGNSEEDQKPKDKKKGFFARLITALSSEEEAENISEENKEILNELAEEDKQKKEKKKKEKKEKKEKKSKKEVKKKPPKKPKKVKAEKDKDSDVPKERPGKPLSVKTLLVLVAFCATILGSIILLSFFLPEYADKMSARRAFNAGDYETVYTLLYDKKLISADELIFNRAKTIRKIERRVEAYENRITLGKELEALDSLLKGVKCYQTLTEADEYGVRQEVDAIYQQICSLLENNYGITAEDAMEINSYDSEAYTRRLQAVVSGDSYGKSGAEQEPEEPAQPAQDIDPEDTALEDVLPEEEELMNN